MRGMRGMRGGGRGGRREGRVAWPRRRDRRDWYLEQEAVFAKKKKCEKGTRATAKNIVCF